MPVTQNHENTSAERYSVALTATVGVEEMAGPVIITMILPFFNIHTNIIRNM